jgi:DNA-binding winged helix-turn-helix (wHTH) protein
MALAYDFDGFRLDVHNRQLTYRGSRIRLTAKALAVLALLAERAPEVVSRAEFEAAVWPEGFIEPANLTQTIYMLRKALGRHTALPPIETVNGRGYRLASATAPGATAVAPVERVPARLGWPVLTSLAAVLLALILLVGAERLAASRVNPEHSAGMQNGTTTHPQAAPAQRL